MNSKNFEDPYTIQTIFVRADGQKSGKSECYLLLVYDNKSNATLGGRAVVKPDETAELKALITEKTLARLNTHWKLHLDFLWGAKKKMKLGHTELMM